MNTGVIHILAVALVSYLQHSFVFYTLENAYLCLSEVISDVQMTMWDMCSTCWWLVWRKIMLRSDCRHSRLLENCLYARTAFVTCFFLTFSDSWN